jgi:2,4-diketo-3-deoxy-L-fuconate hydrolase
VIGEECTSVPEADALSYVAGYCLGLDMTVRGDEERSMRKSIDTYAVLGLGWSPAMKSQIPTKSVSNTM